MTTRTKALSSLPLLLVLATAAAAVEVKNDSYAPGQGAAFQNGFSAGEAAGSSLATGCGATRLQFVQFLFGGTSGQRTVTLQVFDDTAGTAAPGAPLHSASYAITANNSSLAQVDLRAASIDVPARFRIAIQFQHTGLPSVASETSGTQVPNANWIFGNFGGGPVWIAASSVGVTTDWIIRAEVDCTGGASGAVEVKNDGYAPGPGAAFQNSFSAGEAAGSSLTAGCGSTRLQFARFLFGGASGQRTVTLQVFDDTAGTAAPGAPLHSASYAITANDTSLAQVDLRAASIDVPARFRIAIQFQHTGLPSVARDTDGTQVPNANWIFGDFGAGPQWVAASSQGITTDWIIRAEVDCGDGVFGNGFE